MFDHKDYTASLPRRPGVYRMYGAGQELLYVGKARSLKDRVATYFAPRNVDPKVQALVAQISAIEVTVFPRALMELGHKLVDDAIVTVKGRVDKRDDVRFGFMAMDVTIVEGLDASAAALRLKVPSTSLNELKIHQIRKILRDHPGDSPVYLHIGQGKILRLADEFCVDLDRAVGELRMLLGHEAVML